MAEIPASPFPASLVPSSLWLGALQAPLNDWLRDEEEVVADTQKFAAGWMARREADLRAACRLAVTLSSCTNPADVPAAYCAWWYGVVQRALADAQAAQDETRELLEISQRNLMSLSATAAEAVQLPR
jgi:hypothetical protein